MSKYSIIGVLAFGAKQVQSAAAEAMAMLSVSRLEVAPPYTDPPMLGIWSKNGPGQRCSGQDFRNQDANSQYDCEQIAIAAKLPFYQYNERKGLCATCADDLSLKMNTGWDVYRNPTLWPLRAMGQQCTGKRNKKQPTAKSQIECQLAAITLGHTYYQWNAFKEQCSTAKKCKDDGAPANVGTYKLPNPNCAASINLPDVPVTLSDRCTEFCMFGTGSVINQDCVSACNSCYVSDAVAVYGDICSMQDPLFCMVAWGDGLGTREHLCAAWAGPAEAACNTHVGACYQTSCKGAVDPKVSYLLNCVAEALPCN